MYDLPGREQDAPLRSVIPRRIVPSVEPARLSPRQVGRAFHRLVEGGARVRVAGEARHDPSRLLCAGYTPKYTIELFDTTFYLTNVRQNPELRFFVAYVVQERLATGKPEIFPRIFYKDASLVWRSGSHYVYSDEGFWIGKGDVSTRMEDGEEVESSEEATTDLPLELQTALETLNRKPRSVRLDETAIGLVLRRAPHDRILPYRDFLEPRKRAAADRRNLVNGGKSIAHFTRKHDPTSLKIVAGFEPDFHKGILEVNRLTSALYGGALKRFRILSRNRTVQYMFFAGPRHDWIVPPQATTTELSSYGVRTVDVVADEDLFLPGYEYHYLDDGEHFSQIPPGFAGEVNHRDDARADAAPWLDQLPVIREFRRKVLGRQSTRQASRRRTSA
jgi:hypothetical protein